MTYSLSNNCTKNYYNRTFTVQVIIEDVVTWIFLKHSVDAFKETYRGAIMCIFLRTHDFSHILDGCKFCTVKDRNFKFSGNAQQLVGYSAHRKKHLTVHYVWSGNAIKMSKIYPFLCNARFWHSVLSLFGFL